MNWWAVSPTVYVVMMRWDHVDTVYGVYAQEMLARRAVEKAKDVNKDVVVGGPPSYTIHPWHVQED